MTESEREKIVKEIFEAYNRRDIDFIINSFADDLIFVLPSGETIGKDELPQVYSMLFDVFQDGKWSTPRVISKGNVVAVEILVEGTHTGEFLGIPATHKKIEIPAVWFIDFNVEGKIDRVVDYWNERRFIAQVCE
jgi:steroid delta-isomerase-like uncharacterized protein